MCEFFSYVPVQCPTTVPGIVKKIRIAVANEVDIPLTIEQANSGVSTALGDGTTISGAITGVNGGFFYELDIVENSGKIDFPVEGEVGSYSFANSISFKMRGVNAQTLDIWKKLSQCCKGWTIQGLCKDKKEWLSLGDECNPLFLVAGPGSTGAAAGDFKGMEVTLRSESPCPVLIYDAETFGLPLDPALP